MATFIFQIQILKKTGRNDHKKNPVFYYEDIQFYIINNRYSNNYKFYLWLRWGVPGTPTFFFFFFRVQSVLIIEILNNIFFVLVIVLIAIKHRRISFDHVVIATLF
jgi:hypothetical protein